jgi:type IV secretion system protein VirB3
VRELIYKGATRPAVWAGVPLMPFIFVTGIAFLVAMWGMYLVGLVPLGLVALVYIPTVLWMRHITKKDDQRLKQMGLRAQLGFRPRTQVWGRARSFALVELRRVNLRRR